MSEETNKGVNAVEGVHGNEEGRGCQLCTLGARHTGVMDHQGDTVEPWCQLHGWERQESRWAHIFHLTHYTFNIFLFIAILNVESNNDFPLAVETKLLFPFKLLYTQTIFAFGKTDEVRKLMTCLGKNKVVNAKRTERELLYVMQERQSWSSSNGVKNSKVWTQQTILLRK